MRIALVLGCAFVLDLLFGDPNWLPHPVRFIGNLITALEKWLRKCIPNPFVGGLLLSLLVTGVSFVLPFLLLAIVHQYDTTLALLLEIFMAYQILATRSLQRESIKVYTPLVRKDLPAARKWLSYIVGRDTALLDEKGITKATVETIAENTTDGVIAPLLYLAIGGAPLGFLYKAINTMDSMIGYRNEKYAQFGKFAARLDDVANFIPARVSAMLMIVSAFLLKYDVRNAVRMYVRDRKNHKSPNSAQTESVCAGALRIQLAGDATYFGVLTKKPTIGDALRDIQPDDIVKANRLMITTSVLGVLLVCAGRLIYG